MKTSKRFAIIFSIFMVLAMTACKTGVGTLCSVTFDADNGSALVTQTVESGKSVAKPSPDPVKDGYTFAGWYLGETVYNFSSAVTEDITLKAKWTKIEPPAAPKPVKVYYDANGGDFDLEYEELFSGDSLTDKLPVKDGKFFTGWYDDPENGKKLSAVPSTTKNITVYAHWDSSLTSDEGRLTVSYIDDEDYIEVTVRALTYETTYPQEKTCYVTESTTGLSILLGDNEYSYYNYSSPQKNISSSNRETKVKFPFVEKDKVYQFTLNYGTEKVAEHTETVTFISSITGEDLSEYFDVDALKGIDIKCSSTDYTADFSMKGKRFFGNKINEFKFVSKAWGSIDVISGAVDGENNVTIKTLSMRDLKKSNYYSNDFSELFAQDDPYDIEVYLGDDCVDLAANPTWYCEGNVKFIINSTTYPNVYTLGGLFKPESGKEAKSYYYGKKASASITVTMGDSPYSDIDVTYSLNESDPNKVTFNFNNYSSFSDIYWNYLGKSQYYYGKSYTIDFSSCLPGSYPVYVQAYKNGKWYEKYFVVHVAGTTE